MTDDTEEKTVEMTQPIIIDLGKHKAKAINALKEGEGELWDDMLDVVTEVKQMLGEESAGKVVIPVVLIYEKKRKRPRLDKMIFPTLR